MFYIKVVEFYAVSCERVFKGKILIIDGNIKNIDWDK